ncbi:HAD-like protein [Lichtheimia hyalospora FSU 10163]|nr:HAD-like protein [Lichtheimia hyalospora FSU 10163]
MKPMVKTDPPLIKTKAGPHCQPKVRAPSEQYLKLSQQQSEVCDGNETRKQLIVLDLNGTLVSRTGKRGGYRGMYVRPYHDEFLEYLFEHFTVMVWSSAQPHSVDNMCRMFGEYRSQLYKVWDRTHLGLTHADYHRKSVTIKDLEFIWRDSSIANDNFDATNTILLDDSPAKAVLQPYNAIHLATFDHKSSTFREHGERELLSVIRYLDKVRRHSNLCNYMRQHPYKSPDILEEGEKENKTCVYHYPFDSQDKEKRSLQDLRVENTQKEDQLLEKLRSMRL